MVSSDSIRTLQEKAEQINLVLLQPNVDLWKLREMALTEGGLVNGALHHCCRWCWRVGLASSILLLLLLLFCFLKLFVSFHNAIFMFRYLKKTSVAQAGGSLWIVS
jgi:hypothetical protein